MKGYNELVNLLNTVQATGGLDCDTASVCEYQDMIGHSTDDELRELSNGSCREAFYRVYGLSYGTTAAITFYLNHSQKIYDWQIEKEDLSVDLDEAREKITAIEKKAKKNFETAENFRAEWEKEKAEKEKAEKELAAAQDEIIRLKAMLFDCMLNEK